MKILLLHQNYPGQFRELFRWLAAQPGHDVVFLTQRKDPEQVRGARVMTYAAHHRPGEGAYALSAYWEECCGNGYGAAIACERLTAEGFRPDIVIGHAGWGELLFVKEVWPGVPVVGLFEYFFLASGGCVGFDPEFPARDTARFSMKARNAVHFASLHSVDLGYCPTIWQKNTFPESFHDKLYVCHEGIRTDLLRPDPDARIRLGRIGRDVSRKDEVVTFVARNLEPVRGFHVFMRALPAILDARPEARVIVVGGKDVSYGRKPDETGGYRGRMERELGDRVDWSRVHFVGRVSYSDFRRIIQIARCHVYMSQPFVLSWSVLEAMSMEATVVASDTAPVREVIEHGRTGLLVDYFDTERLAAQVVEVLSHPASYVELGQAARRHVVAKHDFLSRTLPRHIDRINGLIPPSLRLSEG